MMRNALALATLLGACQLPWMDQNGSQPLGAGDVPMSALEHDAFPIESGAHANVTCDSCHGEAASFRRFNCTSCHEHDAAPTNARHRDVRGYAYGAETCYTCHPSGEGQPLDHSAFFPIGKGAVHAKVDCVICHPDAKDRSVLGCTGCHTLEKTSERSSDIQTRHASVSNFQWESRACYACHPQANVPVTGFDHKKFPIGPASKHEGAACSDCHRDPANRKVFECTSCHTDAKTTPSHKGVAAYKWESASCYHCHPAANAVGVDFEHTGFPIDAGDKHDKAKTTCASCHPKVGDKSVFDCTTCHTDATTTPKHASVSGYKWASASCYQCHPNADVGQTVDHSKIFPIAQGDAHSNIACNTCHLSTTDRTQLSCAGSCHPSAKMKTEHTPVGGYVYDSKTCLRCHADSQVNPVATHTGYSIKSGQEHYKVSCLTCHPRMRVDKPFGEDFSTCSCKSCHSKHNTCP